MGITNEELGDMLQNLNSPELLISSGIVINATSSDEDDLKMSLAYFEKAMKLDSSLSCLDKKRSIELESRKHLVSCLKKNLLMFQNKNQIEKAVDILKLILNYSEDDDSGIKWKNEAKRYIDDFKSNFSHPSITITQIKELWQDVLKGFQSNSFDRFIWKAGACLDLAIKYKYFQIFGTEPPSIKKGMDKLRIKGIINDRQSNLNWVWEVRNEVIHTGIDLDKIQYEKVFQIVQNIIEPMISFLM